MKSIRDYGGWALITGASAGIGEAYARHLAAAGVNCVLVARRRDRLDALAHELEDRHGIQTRVLDIDLAERDAPARIAEGTAGLHVGMVINNAGFGDAGAFQTRAADRVASMIDVNCRAVALLTRLYLPGMLERKRGAIVIVSSVLGIIPCPYESTYGATKAFDLSFGLGLWEELRGTGVDCLTVCPGQTATEFLEAEGLTKERAAQLYRRATRPEEIARITFRDLGRKPVTGPREVHLVNFLHRVLPWRIQTGLVKAFFRRVMPDRMGL